MVAKAKDDKNALDFVINQWGSQEVAIRCTAGKLICSVVSSLEEKVIHRFLRL